jgi:hypothetical protein
VNAPIAPRFQVGHTWRRVTEQRRSAASALEHMNTISPRSRMTLTVSYAFLILLPCLLIALAGLLPHSVTLGTCLAYAFALLPTYHLDHLLLGGIGYHSPVVFALTKLISLQRVRTCMGKELSCSLRPWCRLVSSHAWSLRRGDG